MKGFNGALMRYLGANEHKATVIETRMLTAHMRRIRFRSESAYEDIRITAGSYLRCWFPDAQGKEHQRAYTLLEMDPQAGEFTMDFLLHDPAGPASTWARDAEVGDELAVTPFGVRHFEVPTPPPPGYLLVCDAAGIPAINTIIEAIDSEIEIIVYLGVDHREDIEIPICAHPRLTIHRIPMRTRESLAQAIEPRDFSGWRAYLIPEASALRSVRKRLSDEFGFPRSHISAQAYWKAGKNMGLTRDLPQAEDLEVTVPETSPDPAPATNDSHDGAAASEWDSTRGSRLLKPVKPAMIISGIAQAIITCVELAPYLILAEAGRRILAGAAVASLTNLLWAFLIIMGAGASAAAALTIIMHVVDARFSASLRLRLLDHLSRLPLGWFSAKGRAGVRRVLTDDISAIHYLVTHAVVDAVGAIVAPLVVLIYLFVLDWRLALICLIPVLIHLFVLYTMVFRSFAAVTEAPRRAEHLRTHALAYVEAQPVIAIFPGAGAVYRRELREYISFLQDWQIPFSSLKTTMTLVSQPATFVLAIAAGATPLVLSGRMSLATVLPFLFLGTTFASKLLAIGYEAQNLRTGITAANDIAAVLAEPELTIASRADGKNTHDGAAPPATAPAVSAHGLSFAYERGHDVLHDVSFDIPAGSTCALVGPSGAGKSTLAALIARFFQGRGTLAINGIPIEEIHPDELYRKVGFVFQDVEIVRGTIAENIALATPEASAEQIQAAAKKARIHDRIMRLPTQYDTVIGGKGFLSGGELQRIAIARLLLANPPILILDEATAYADPTSAAEVSAALDELAGGRTVITIAHRLSSITHADQILVIDQGTIVQRGTHHQLLTSAGTYRDLWEAGCLTR